MQSLSRLANPFKKRKGKSNREQDDSSGILSTSLSTIPASGNAELVPVRLANTPSSSNILCNSQNVRFEGPVTFEERNTTVVAGESAAMTKLLLHVDPNAAVDSSARQPPPTCHPKTRRETRNKLTKLFDDLARKYRMGWLSGAAGTGKSALGQTFATNCRDKHRLGAAFFFSRPSGRNKYETVIPTLASQLATHCPVYRPAMLARVDNDPQIFDKAPPVQLKKLIVEPLLEVRSKITTTFLILLDGVDECGAHPNDAYEREREQRELVKMIADTVRDHPDLPLFWLLCSRPEQHLLDAFTRITTICKREDLVIDAKCREEVEVVLREGFAKIAEERGVISPGPDGWPSRNEFDTVERAVSGLHVFGAAILKDIEYSDSPVQQLKSLIPFLEHVAGADSPRSIQDMDKFYLRILADVPSGRLPTTLKIIGALITMPKPQRLSAQALCNFLHLDPNDFASALRKVHSVISIPPPQAVHNTALHLYHASFSDFLFDASRSANFFIDSQKVRVDTTKLCFFWQELHSNLFHSSDQPHFFSDLSDHHHDPLPHANLEWITSRENHRAISDMICKYAQNLCFSQFSVLPKDVELLAFIHQSDLRHMTRDYVTDTIPFLKWVSDQDRSGGFIRTEPESEEDRILLTYLETMTTVPISPARLPLDWQGRSGSYCEYLLIGRNLLSIIIWITKGPSTFCAMALNLDQKPNESTIQLYQNTESFKGWKKHINPVGVKQSTGTWN